MSLFTCFLGGADGICVGLWHRTWLSYLLYSLTCALDLWLCFQSWGYYWNFYALNVTEGASLRNNFILCICILILGVIHPNTGLWWLAVWIHRFDYLSWYHGPRRSPEKECRRQGPRFLLLRVWFVINLIFLPVSSSRSERGLQYPCLGQIEWSCVRIKKESIIPISLVLQTWHLFLEVFHMELGAFSIRGYLLRLSNSFSVICVWMMHPWLWMYLERHWAARMSTNSWHVNTSRLGWSPHKQKNASRLGLQKHFIHVCIRNFTKFLFAILHALCASLE